MECALSLPVGGGRYELPGCTPGRVYPVFFLDAANGCGATLNVTAGLDAGPDVRLAPCGFARVRVLDAKGRPLARKHMELWLLAEPSFRAAQLSAQRLTLPELAAWHDPVHYADTPQCDEDGWVLLPALIPSARYFLYDRDTDKRYPEFTVKAGERKQLPDIVLAEPHPELPVGD
jgi:hypothetical protein